jgi:TonB-dependent starch-binding outer membrane protein SusC
METMVSGRHSGRPNDSHRARTVGMIAGLALTFAFASAATAQTGRVTGTVTSPGGAPLPGVIVRVVGDTAGAQTNAQGRYAINAPATGTLRFTLIGYRAHESPVNRRTTIDVTMERLAVLDQVVVTAYSGEQRRSEITGAVASVNVEAVERQTSASVLQRLDANVTGVTVNNSGSPGGRSTVRIRGISSFQNNNPLYIVDGTPVQDDYVNFLNPNDVSSIQVLKDASAASIYGSRASNGVVIIETVKGASAAAPRTRLRLRTGVATPTRGYDDFLITDALEYYRYVQTAYQNAGLTPPTNIFGSATNPTVPKYIWPNNCGANGGTGVCTTVNEANYSYPNSLIMPGSAGTNWWDAVFGTGRVADANLDVTGGGTGTSYAVSFNYFDQTGTAAYNRFSRGSVRVNTSFTRGRFTTGENFSISGDRSYGGLGGDAGGETGLLGKNILSQPVVPIYDINGNFASGKAVGLGNNTNPLKVAYEGRNNINLAGRIFGNVFGNFEFVPGLALRSTLGINAGQNQFTGYSFPTPENSEPNFNNSINESQFRSFDYTWSNTLNYRKGFGNHNVALLLGQEANRFQSRNIGGSIASLINSNVSSRYIADALGDASTKNVNSSGGVSALLSYFGRADYNYADRYTLSFTLRRDGSSRLGPANQWGTFPAVGAGWRVSEEGFLRNSDLISDLMLRVGWGVTGNQQIPSGRIASQFGGGRNQTFYDIGGSNTSILAGYRQTSIGNPELKWEESRSINGGLDLGLWNGAINVVLDIYSRDTDNLLFDPVLPGTAGAAAQPIVNVGKMNNKGFDVSVGHRSEAWDLTVNASHYKNKIVRIDGSQTFFYGPATTRFGNQIINKIDSPIASFFGYQADGFFRDAADVAAHAAQEGKAPGRIKFRDVNGDGRITLADRTIIGNPHPDLTAGVDGAVRRGKWELSGTVFGSFGNDIWDAQKEFYIFSNFSTNVRKDRLTDSWTPENQNAKYPRIDQNDTQSSALSSFYVEDGSFVRLRNLQLAYTLPEGARYLRNARIYLQAENLFTITGYDGLDPALPVRDVTSGGRDVRDQYRGVDTGVYPSNRTFSIGITTSF